ERPAPAVGASVLLVLAAVEVAGPAPFLGTGYQRGRIDGLDHRGVGYSLVVNLVHRRAVGVHVAVRAVPDARLIVQQIVAQPTARRSAPRADQVLNPTSLESLVRGDIRIRWIVPDDVLSRARQHAVSRVREPLPVV